MLPNRLLRIWFKSLHEVHNAANLRAHDTLNSGIREELDRVHAERSADPLDVRDTQGASPLGTRDRLDGDASPLRELILRPAL